MRRSQGRTPRSSNLAHGIAQRASFLVFVLLSVALLILGKLNPKLSGTVQGTLVDAAAPVVDLVGEPVDAIQDFGRRTGDVLRGADRVEALRKENERLRRWQDVALRLDEENARLRSLLRVKERMEMPSVTSRVVTDSSGPFLRAIILDAGGLKGVASMQPVVDEIGVVGRIVTVGERSSRALLLTDLNSRLPVRIVRTGTRAILSGNNGPTPRLTFVPIEASIEVGDEVVTSGDGGMFPPNLKVGTVVAVESGAVRVDLAADLDRLDFVNVLAYDPPPPPEDYPVAEPLEAEPDGPSVAENGETD